VHRLAFSEDPQVNLIPQNKKDPKLGFWLRCQRERQAQLSADKIAKPNALGITWNGVKQMKANELWEAGFQLLLDFKKGHDHCRAPTKWTKETNETKKKLALWVLRQRRDYMKGRLKKHRVEKLKSIGFIWKLKEQHNGLWRNGQWNEKFNQLLQFKEEHGHCNVPWGYAENKGLAGWVNTQRKTNSMGRLPLDRKERLERVGFKLDFVETLTRKTNSMGRLPLDRKERLERVGFKLDFVEIRVIKHGCPGWRS
jgi:Helicase associated domain